MLVNKIVFHTALRRKFHRLRKIRVPTTISTGEDLQRQLLRYFHEAKVVTRDYETVFDGDFGDTLPFLSDAAVDSWRELVNQIEGFDFTQLDYEIIGHIFERLISPEERHRYGQHYTETEIVDLINAFCIRDPKSAVLDPACGGGTFLVRAYARKRYLAECEPEHAELLEQIKGIDISAYPVHLSTINLATRQLVDTRNYPLVARSDFFDVRPDRPVFHIPFGRAAAGGRQSPCPPFLRPAQDRRRGCHPLCTPHISSAARVEAAQHGPRVQPFYQQDLVPRSMSSQYADAALGHP